MDYEIYFCIEFDFFALFAKAQETFVLCNQGAQNQISFSNQAINRNSSEISLLTWNAYKLSDKKFLPDLQRLSKASDIFVRGFTALKTEVLLEKSSDHYPMKTTLKLK